MDARPSEPEAQPLVPAPARVSLWVRVRPFVAALILVSVSFVGLHIWDQVGPLSEETASSVALPWPGSVEVRQVTPGPAAPIVGAGASATQPSAVTARPSPTPLPAQPTAAPVVSVVPTVGVTPSPPEVVQLTLTDLVITVLDPTLEPTATVQPTARPPQRPRPAVPTAMPTTPRLPARPVAVPTARPVVTRPPVLVPPPTTVPTAVPTAWRVPVQNPTNWARPRPATPAP